MQEGEKESILSRMDLNVAANRMGLGGCFAKESSINTLKPEKWEENRTQYLHAKIFKYSFPARQPKTYSIISPSETVFSVFGWGEGKHRKRVSKDADFQVLRAHLPTWGAKSSLEGWLLIMKRLGKQAWPVLTPPTHPTPLEAGTVIIPFCGWGKWGSEGLRKSPQRPTGKWMLELRFKHR